jgi:hypothetical protein
MLTVAARDIAARGEGFVSWAATPRWSCGWLRGAISISSAPGSAGSIMVRYESFTDLMGRFCVLLIMLPVSNWTEVTKSHGLYP